MKITNALIFPESDTTLAGTPTGTVQAPTQSTAENPNGLKPHPTFDSRYQSVQLPSSFYFYEFKTIFVRGITIRDQLNLYSGHVKATMRNIIEVVSNCTQQDAYALTVGDLYFIMYELRMRSFTKAPLKVQWVCTADTHLKSVEDKTVSADTLQQINTVKSSDLTVNQITEDKWAEIQQVAQTILDDHNIHVKTVMVRDWVESVEVLEDEEEADRAILDFIHKYALVLDGEYHGTLAERRELLVNFENPDLLSDLDLYISLIDHGVEERFNVTCKECGTKDTVKLSLDVPHFFPVSETKRHT